MRYYEYRHIVTFEETNLVGNVYFVNHLRWQGHCREHFLRDHASGVLEELARDLALVTVHCSCDYLSELFAFDEISIRMTLDDIRQNQVRMVFEYWRIGKLEPELVGRGRQHIACMRRQDRSLVAIQVPTALREGLAHYSSLPLSTSAEARA